MSKTPNHDITPKTPQISRLIAEFAAGFPSDRIPARVRHEANRALVNGIGAAFGAAQRAELTVPLAVFAEIGWNGASGPHAIIGRSERLDLLSATFMNSVAINALDFDDTHLPTVIHPTAPIAPPLLALAERGGITGRALLDAFVIGVEVACRLGNSISPGHYSRGFHITATCGVIGAAAAAGRLLGLNPDQMIAALGSAAAQASGLVETLPSQAKSTGVGGASRNGLFAALLAARGWTGPPHPIEGRFGFGAVMGERFDSVAIAGELGERWEVLKNNYKPYPCGVVLNPVLDACLELHAQGVTAEQIAAVEVHGPSLLGERTDRGVVSDGQSGRVSLHHSVAVAFVRGCAGVAEYTDEAARDPAVQALAAKVKYVAEPVRRIESARVVVRTYAGAEQTLVVEWARGSSERPLSDADLEAKARRLAADGAPSVRIDALIDALWSLEQSSDAGNIVKLAAAPSPV